MEARWKAMGIYDLVCISADAMHLYSFDAIMASFFFWNCTTSSFHLPYGMVTLTLYDVVAITALPPTGEDFPPPTSTLANTAKIDTTNMSYKAFVVNNTRQTDEISKEEHVAFLMRRLSSFVFCCRSFQVHSQMQVFAQLLHEGHKLNLCKLLLGHLYSAFYDAYIQL